MMKFSQRSSETEASDHGNDLWATRTSELPDLEKTPQQLEVLWSHMENRLTDWNKKQNKKTFRFWQKLVSWKGDGQIMQK